MASYRSAKFGAVESSVLDPTLKSICDGMVVYLGSSQDFKYLKSPKVLADLIRQFKMITGNDFRGWLSANYNDGTGVRASLVRNILNFLNGQISGRMVVEAIIRDTRTVISFERTGGDIVTEATRHIADEHHLSKWSKYLENVVNEDMYRLLEGISPEHLARLILSLSGEAYDV